MKRHISSHLNYRRYGCPYCALLFTQSTFVLNHVRSKHPGKRLSYDDNKVEEVEEKIRESWVNLKEVEARGDDKEMTSSLVPYKSGSRLRSLLTGQLYTSTGEPVGDEAVEE